MNHEKLIEQFKAERKKKKLSQENVADRCDLSHSGITKVERLEREPKLSTFMEMCEAVGLMVVLAPIPAELYNPYVEPAPIVEEIKPVDYDNFEETIGGE